MAEVRPPGRGPARLPGGLEMMVTARLTALPLLFEGPHGAQEGHHYTHAQIVDMYLILFGSLMAVGVQEGFRPHPDW